MRTFKYKNIEIVCESKDTRNGFKHEATLLINGTEQARAKINYLNRTWESFEFESVIKEVLEETNTLTDKQKERFLEKMSIDSEKQMKKEFGLITAVAQMGDLLVKGQAEKNKWKKRMLTAGLENKGLQFPEDWDGLDEKTKEKRLNGVMGLLNN